jgi:hypothetical protein
MRIITMHARNRKEGDIHFRVPTPLLAHDVHPPVAVPWLGHRIRRKIIVKVFILAGQKTIVAIVAFGHIDD